MEPNSRPESLARVPVARVTVPRTIRALAIAFLGAGLFAVLTFVGASIRIPLQPVPVTLQTLFVLLAGAVLGSRTGVLSQSTYLLMGIAGLPLFAGTVAGLAVLTGPTGGYLAGFVVTPFVVGRLIRKHDSFLWQLTVFSVGSAVILLLGVIHLAVFYTGNFSTALKVGFLPFLFGDALKILAAASIYRSHSHLRRVRRTR